jgi:DNA-binding transcriptional LysR family regulator
LTHQNVTRAAKAVGLGQSSMSHALSRLRAHFEDPLLVRVGRKLVLTDRGKSLMEPVEEALAHLELVFERKETFEPKTSRRRFRIAATDNVELYVLPDLSTALREAAPGIDLRVFALPADWPTALERGDIDLKLGRKSTLPEALESQDILRERFACVVRAGHSVRGRPSVEEYAALDHLLVAPTALPGTEPTGLVDAHLAKRGLRRRVAMTVPHFLVAPFIIARSDLALTGPARLLSRFADQLGLRYVELPIELGGYVLTQVWAARASNDEAHRFVRSLLLRSAGATR